MNDQHDLIDRLCAIAGMIFEDISAEAVSTNDSTETRTQKIELIKRAAADARTLADASMVVLQRPAD
jgi:hypothetical protein